MSVRLFCDYRQTLRISVRKGKGFTNTLADEIDCDKRFDVQGTAFSKGTASIHFSVRRHTPWQTIANFVGLCMKGMFGDPTMPVRITRLGMKDRVEMG